jgi:membrane protease YdiL (CAAX protease family)
LLFVQVSWPLVPIALCARRGIDLVEGNYFRLPSLWETALTAMLVLSLFWLLSGWIEIQNRLFEPDLTDLKREVRQLKESGAAAAALQAAAWPAFREEMAFRGLGLSGMARSGFAGPGILFGGVLFGLIHSSWGRIIPTAVLGMAWGFLATRTRSIFAAMLAHALNNVLAVFVDRAPLEPLVLLCASAVLTLAIVELEARHRGWRSSRTRF